MQLTPVRVRGKRKAPTTKTPLALQSPEKKMKKSLETVLAARSLRQRPVLESLPSEILESILLYSMNPSLPRASHLIGAKLSGRATLLRFLIWAFNDTWGETFGTSPGYAKIQGSEGDPRLQTAVLALPWVTIDFILQAQQTWADRYARGRCYEHYQSKVAGKKVSSTSEHTGVCDPFDARACFEADYQRAIDLFLDPDRERRQDVHPAAHMPSNLITGPWNDEQLRRLFWLTRSGVHLLQDNANDITWEMKMLCLRNAVLDVSELNTFVVNHLLRDLLLGDQVLPLDVVRKELTNLDVRLRWGGDSPEGREVVRFIRERLQHVLDS